MIIHRPWRSILSAMLGLLCAGTNVAMDIPLDGRIEETQVGRYEVEGPFGFNRKYFSDEIPCREIDPDKP